MRNIFMVILFAALPALAATPGFAHAHDDSVGTVDTGSRDPFPPRHGDHPANGFGRLAPDSVVECFGSCEARVLP